MANRYFIKQQKDLRARYDEDLQDSISAIYSTIAIVLSEGGLSNEDIAYICGRSQKLWEEHAGNIIDMLVKCYNLTGIQVMSPEQYAWAKKEGLIEESDDEKIPC